MIKAGWLRRDFPSQIWEALIVSDPVHSWGGIFRHKFGKSGQD